MTGRCAILPIALPHCTLCDAELIAERHGLTLIAVRPVASVAAVSAAIDEVAASLIDVTGSTLLVDGSSYTDRKKRRIGPVVSRMREIHRHLFGGQCR